MLLYHIFLLFLPRIGVGQSQWPPDIHPKTLPVQYRLLQDLSALTLYLTILQVLEAGPNPLGFYQMNFLGVALVAAGIRAVTEQGRYAPTIIGTPESSSRSGRETPVTISQHLDHQK